MIHYLKSGSADLNLGKAINGTIKHLPDKDWICLMDIDTMPAYHEKFYKQCEDIAKTDFGLVGCMTNRVGLQNQLLNGELSNNTDWKKHRQDGKELYLKYGSSIKLMEFKHNNIADCIAGLFMLFPKKVWLEVGGFLEGHIRIDGGFIDWHFSKAVIQKGFKIGIAEGLYMIHMYRPDHINPRCRTEHLEK